MLFIFCDSAIEPYNPNGLLTWAFLVKKDGKVIHSEADIIGWGEGMTNNLGEYSAVMAAMKWLIFLPEKVPAIIHSDSQLVIKQVTGSWECREEKLKSILNLIQKARSAYPKSLTFRWIPREKNTEADALSRTPYIGKEKAIEILKARRNEALFGDDDLSW